MLGKNEFFVIHDDELGVVWSPELGSMRITDAKHSELLEECLSRYVSDELSEKEEKELETYLREAFHKEKALQIVDNRSLLERKSICRLELMLVNTCNLDCRYCYACGGTYGLKSSAMSPEQAVKYLNALFESRYESVDEVMFFGGEPTLCPDTIEAVCNFFLEKAADKKIKNIPQYTMVSNATLIDEKIAAILCKHDIKVTVSVDGPKEINDKLRVDKNGQGTFEQAEKGIEAIRKAGGDIRLVEATYTSEHQKMGYSRKDICEYIKEHFKVKYVMIGDCEENEKNHSLQCIDDDEWNYFYNQHEHGCKKRRLLKAMSYKKIVDSTCESGYGSFIIMPSGEMFPCHFFVNHPEYKMAEYKNGTFDFSKYQEVLARLELSHKTKNQRCKDCWARVTCEMCPAQLLLNQSNNIESYCGGEKKKQERMILQCAKELQKQGTL